MRLEWRVTTTAALQTTTANVVNLSAKGSSIDNISQEEKAAGKYTGN